MSTSVDLFHAPLIKALSQEPCAAAGAGALEQGKKSYCVKRIVMENFNSTGCLGFLLFFKMKHF